MNSLHVALKDIRILIRDIPGLIYLIITPIIIIAIASFALSGLFNSSVNQFKVPVVVEDMGDHTKDFLEQLQKITAIKVVTTYMDKNKTEQPMIRAEAEKSISETKAAIIIPQGFSQAIDRGEQANIIVIKDPVDRVIPEVVINIVTEYTNKLSIGLISKSVSVSAVQALTQTAQQQYQVSLDPRPEIQKIQTQTNNYINNPPVKVEVNELKPDPNAHKASPFESNVPGYAVMFVLLGTASGALTLLEERENGTLRKLLTLPISRFSILGGKTLSNFITAVLQSLVLFAVGHFVFGMWLGKSIGGLLLLIITTAFAATGLAMLVASFSRTRAQANGISLLLVLSMSALGGSWWPLYIVPDWMQKIAHITLTAWAMDGFNSLLIYGKGITDILISLVVLLGMGAVSLFIAVQRFRFNNN